MSTILGLFNRLIASLLMESWQMHVDVSTYGEALCLAGEGVVAWGWHICLWRSFNAWQSLQGLRTFPPGLFLWLPCLGCSKRQVRSL